MKSPSQYPGITRLRISNSDVFMHFIGWKSSVSDSAGDGEARPTRCFEINSGLLKWRNSSSITKTLLRRAALLDENSFRVLSR
jgi:hypothetical protein